MRKTYKLFAQLSVLSAAFGVNFWEETPRNKPIDLPTKGVKGMTNAELKPHKSGKNKLKRRKK